MMGYWELSFIIPLVLVILFTICPWKRGYQSIFIAFTAFPLVWAIIAYSMVIMGYGIRLRVIFAPLLSTYLVGLGYIAITMGMMLLRELINNKYGRR